MKTLIAIPCMDMVHTLFMTSILGLKHPPGIEFGVISSSLVYDARNRLATKAIDEGFDRVFWIDSDMYFEPETMEKLEADMDTGLDFVCGIYFTRKAPVLPCVYSALEVRKKSGIDTPTATAYKDYPKDSLFEVAGAGFAGVMTSTKLLHDVADAGKFPFSPMLGWGEDFSFCLRARALGYRLWCDSRIKIGHIGQSIVDEAAWGAQKNERS